MRSASSAFVISVASAASLSACATNPATGERQLALISESQEVQMGRAAAQQVQQTLTFVDDAALQDYVDRIGRQLASKSERPELPWAFRVIDNPAPNAFALPGGFIYVTRGMLNLLTSEAELASVLGHEIAHVTARHSVSQVSQQQLAQLGIGLGSILFPAVQEFSPFIGAGLNLLFLKHSRDDEREADELGFEYVAGQNYAVSEFADVFAVLQRAGDGKSGGLPGWLSTHPMPAERVETARIRAAGAMGAAGRVGRDPYLRSIDNLVYGENPRHGFFRDNTFYHPDLRFRVRFPGGWETQNLAQAVVGAAPDGRAAVELTLAPGAGPEQAFQRFLRQQGLQIGARSARRIQGLPAVIAEFVAQTGTARVRGLAAFIEHRGRVYQLIAYGSAYEFGAIEPLLSTTIESFGPVTDPAVLGVDPQRVDVVQLTRDQTLSEFARRFPSTIPVEQLAVINHVPRASSRLQAGLLVKRVI
jgi:predicted Zn-dependent protease